MSHFPYKKAVLLRLRTLLCLVEMQTMLQKNPYQKPNQTKQTIKTTTKIHQENPTQKEHKFY